MDEKNFSHDVKYGYTKIFIRSPQTLFALEKVRQCESATFYDILNEIIICEIVNCVNLEFIGLILFAGSQRIDTRHRDTPAKAMARISLSSAVQENESRPSADEVLQEIQTTHLYQRARANIPKRQEDERLRQAFDVAAREFRCETRSACPEEHVCKMAGVDGTQSDSSGRLATTKTEGTSS
jgi:hypothetical protein